jgi:uncharacterized protein (DUF779 family)
LWFLLKCLSCQRGRLVFSLVGDPCPFSTFSSLSYPWAFFLIWQIHVSSIVLHDLPVKIFGTSFATEKHRGLLLLQLGTSSLL